MNIYTALSNDHRLFESQLGDLVKSSKADDDGWKTIRTALSR